MVAMNHSKEFGWIRTLERNSILKTVFPPKKNPMHRITPKYLWTLHMKNNPTTCTLYYFSPSPNFQSESLNLNLSMACSVPDNCNLALPLPSMWNLNFQHTFLSKPELQKSITNFHGDQLSFVVKDFITVDEVAFSNVCSSQSHATLVRQGQSEADLCVAFSMVWTVEAQHRDM